MIDLTSNFDTHDGKVLYDRNFINDTSSIEEELLQIGTKFPRTDRSNRVRGGMCETGKEMLVSERTIKGVPGIPWGGTCVEVLAKSLTTLLRGIEIIPKSSKLNYCLYNMYESGRDRIGYHSDSERNSMNIIASLTIGLSRKFVFLHKETNNTNEISLGNGSLLIFSGDINQRYMHCVPPICIKSGQESWRINLTFRVVFPEIVEIIKNPISRTDVKTSGITGFQRKSFTDDFWIITPTESLTMLNKCIMYKNWGIVGNFTCDMVKMCNKINKLSETSKSRVHSSSDWFILPNKLSLDELVIKFSSIDPYMKWKYVYEYVVPVQLSIYKFSEIYLQSPSAGVCENSILI